MVRSLQQVVCCRIIAEFIRRACGRHACGRQVIFDIHSVNYLLNGCKWFACHQHLLYVREIPLPFGGYWLIIWRTRQAICLGRLRLILLWHGLLFSLDFIRFHFPLFRFRLHTNPLCASWFVARLLLTFGCSATILSLCYLVRNFLTCENYRIASGDPGIFFSFLVESGRPVQVVLVWDLIWPVGALPMSAILVCGCHSLDHEDTSTLHTQDLMDYLFLWHNSSQIWLAFWVLKLLQ